MIPLVEANSPVACVGSPYMPHQSSHLSCAERGCVDGGVEGMSGLWALKKWENTLEHERNADDSKATFYFSVPGACLTHILFLCSLC